MLPIMRVYVVVPDLWKLYETMTNALGIRVVNQVRDSEADADFYALSNASVVAIQPHNADSPVGLFLNEFGGGMFGFEIVQPDSLISLDEGVPIVGKGFLSQIRYQELPLSKIRLLKGLHSDSVLDSNCRLALDHLAYVVTDIDVALHELGIAAKVEESDVAGRWDFPELGSTNAILPFYKAFLELNHVTGKGMFESSYSRFGPSALFICLRVNDLHNYVKNLQQSGVNVSDPAPVRARPIHTNEEKVLGHVAIIPLRYTQGARIMLLEPDWPWNIIQM
jgi:hypothetical protein